MISPNTLISYSFLAQVVATFCMTGVIWLIQLVHYPLMAWVNRPDFTEYSQRHTQFITYLVGPLMVVEAMTATLWLYTAKKMGLPYAYAWSGLLLVGIIWGATAFFSIPCHEILTQGFDQIALDRLVNTNWIRTLAWTGRTLLLCLALKEMLRF